MYFCLFAGDHVKNPRVNLVNLDEPSQFYGGLPVSLSSKLVGLPVIPLRSDRQFDIVRTQSSFNFINLAPMNQFSKVWNELPIHIKSCSNYRLFKSLLFIHCVNHTMLASTDKRPPVNVSISFK